MTPPALTPTQQAAATYFKTLQARVCTAVEALESKGSFRSEVWRDAACGGEMRVLEGGEFIEKAGVGTRDTHGILPQSVAAELPGDGAAFWASEVHLALYPRSPFVPAVHAHFRMVQRGTAWFSGSVDMTPYYPVIDDVQHFHRVLKAACDAHDPALHPDLKTQADAHFYLPHRAEHCGVGGLYFDALTPERAGRPIDVLFACVRSIGDAVLDAFLPIAKRRMGRPYDARHRAWQAARRGRSAEFSLMSESDPIFGLGTPGHSETMLMALPPAASWRFAPAPSPTSPEARLAEVLVPRDWAGGATLDDAPTRNARAGADHVVKPSVETAPPPIPPRPRINYNPPQPTPRPPRRVTANPPKPQNLGSLDPYSIELSAFDPGEFDPDSFDPDDA